MPLEDERLMTVVELALARHPSEHEAYLRSVCANDSELFSRAMEFVAWEVRMEGFLPGPLFQALAMDPPFELNDLLADRFRLTRVAGEGGMAWVYEAADEKLGQRVAVKCPKPAFRKRLPPETGIAREITHTNVCRIFEIHTAQSGHGEIDFIAMEFLDGPTLAERLSSRSLSKKEARQIAAQLCAGLAEAHRAGVVHGDLKSGNVILANEDYRNVRAVITDFGLARRSQETLRGAQSGSLRGTPDYMAPELWKGDKASAASDIYALGVILFELASHRRLQPPKPGSQDWLGWKPPAVNSKWDRVIKRCLDPDPARRFSDANEVAKALEDSHRVPRALKAAAVVAIVALFVVAIRLYLTRPEESVRLAVLPFELAGDARSEAEKLIPAVMDRVGRLEGNKHTGLSVIPMKRVLGEHVDSVKKAGTLLGATHVLSTRVEKEQNQLRLRASLANASSGLDVKEWIEEYDDSEETYIPVFLASVITDALHLAPLDSARSVKEAAREDYERGLANLRRDSTISGAVASFERTVQEDPESPLGYAGLCEGQLYKYYFSREHKWLDRAKESARQAQRRDLDLAPVHRVTGLLFAAARRRPQALAELRRAIEIEPRDVESYRRLGQVYELSGQNREALQAFQTAVSLEPDYYRTQVDLGAYYFNRGEYEKALPPKKASVDLAPNESNVLFGLSATYLNLGMYKEAEQQLRRATALDKPANALRMLGLALIYEERDAEAILYIQRALTLDPENYLGWMHLGMAYRRTNHQAASREANLRGQRIVDKALEGKPADGYLHAMRGYFSATLGDTNRAKLETSLALTLAPEDAETRVVAVETYEALDNRDLSLKVLEQLPRPQLLDIMRWPGLKGLHNDIRFQQLLADHEPK